MRHTRAKNASNAEVTAREQMKNFIDKVVREIETSAPVAAQHPNKDRDTNRASATLRAKRRRTA